MTTWLNREFIKTLEAELQMAKFTVKAVVPEHAGNKGRYNVFPNPPGSTTALTEGIQAGASSNEITLTTTGQDITIAEYGEWMPVPSLADYAGVEGMRAELVKRFSYGGSLSIDSQIIAAATASTTVWAAAATASLGQTTLLATTAGGAMSASVLMAAAKQIRNLGTRGFSGIEGHPDGHLAAILTPQQELELTTEATTGRATWQNMVVNVPGPSGQGKAINGFMGSIYHTAAYMSKNTNLLVAVGGNTYSASRGFVLGDGGVAALSFQQMDPQVFINTPSSGDVGNPYRNRYTVAWHAFFGSSLGPDGSSRVVKLYTTTV